MRMTVPLSVRLATMTVGGVMLTIAACQTDSLNEPVPITAIPIAFSGSSSGHCGTFNNTLPDDVYPDWPCDNLIHVNGGSGNTAALAAATNEWNGAIPSTLGLPRFTSSSQTSQITITGSSASPVNGVWSGTRGGSVNVNLAAASGSGSGNPTSITLHEIGHIMGLGNTWDGGGYRKPGVSDHCVSSATAPGGGGIYDQTQLCQHLVELYLFIYGASSTAPSWDKHIVTSLVGFPLALTMQSGDSTMVTISSFGFQRASPDLDIGEGISPPAGSLVWTTSDSGVANLVGSGNGRQVVAGVAGTATITVGININTSLYQAAALMRDTFTVTVGPPPATQPSGFRVNGCEEIPGPGAGRLRVRYHLRWDAGDGSWEIRHATVNNVANATVMATGGEGQTTEWTPYYKFFNFGFQYRYWWISVTPEDPSSWVPSTSNPVQLGDGCNF